MESLTSLDTQELVQTDGLIGVGLLRYFTRG